MNIKIDYVKIIKSKLRISDIIGKDVKLIKSGNQLKALCPFHNEKTPSFVVNDDKESYVCYGCGSKGDIFSYIMEKYKIDFKEAIRILALEAGIDFEEKKNTFKNISTDNRKKYYSIMSHVAKFYHENLIDYLRNNRLSFLEEKKINQKLISDFYLGLSTNFEELEINLKKNSINTDDLIDLGIIKTNKYGKKYDMFNNRVMFPIKDNLERVIAFGGRRLDSEGPKYINSWENDFFKKRNILYNMNCMNSLKNKTDDLLLVEGYTDVIALQSAGFKAVAPLGTAISTDQIKLAWKYVNEPILFLDGDTAGINASNRVLNLVLPELKPDKSLKFVLADDSKDPEEIINHDNGVAAIHNILANKISFFDAMTFFESNKELNSPERLLGFKNRLLSKLDLIEDLETKDLYKFFLKKKYSSLIESNFTKSNYAHQSYQKDKYFVNISKRKTNKDFVLRRERAIIGAMLNNFKLLTNYDEVLAKIYLSNNDLNKLRDAIIDIISSEKIENSMELKTAIIKKGFTNLIKKHFVTSDCINFNLVERYAKESTDLEYSKKALLEILNIQEKWYNNKNKILSNNL